MKLVFEVRTEPVTQASVIIGVIAFSSGALALIAIYTKSPLVCALLCDRHGYHRLFGSTLGSSLGDQ